MCVLSISTRTSVYEAVEKDHADLGLVSYPRVSRTIEAMGWREEPMVLVCAAGHRLAALETVAFDDLAGERVIGFDSDLTIRREIDRVLQLHDVEVQVVMEFDNIETIKRAVEIDAGVALLPEPTVLREVAAGTLGDGAAGHRRARSAAGHHSSPRQGAGQHDAAIHRVIAERGTGRRSARAAGGPRRGRFRARDACIRPRRQWPSFGRCGSQSVRPTRVADRGRQRAARNGAP